MNQSRLLLAGYIGLGFGMTALILLNLNRFTSVDSGYYLQSATNLLAGRGYVVSENGQLIWNGTFPIGYSALIAVFSGLTGLPVLAASKLVNYTAIGISGYCWTRRLGAGKAAWILSIWVLGGFLKIAVYTWSETVFLVLLAEWVWGIHQFLLKPNASQAVVFFLIGISLFLIRYMGGFVFGFTSVLTLLIGLLPSQLHQQLALIQTRSIRRKLLLVSLAGITVMSVCFGLNQQLSGSFFGGERFTATESPIELVQIFGWAILNEWLLIRDFVPARSDELAWVGLGIQLVLVSTAYQQFRQIELHKKKTSVSNPLIWLFILTGSTYLLVLFSLRSSSPFSNPNLRLMAPFTFCFLMAGFLYVGNRPARWQTNLCPYWIALVAFSWLQLLPQANLIQKISLLLNRV